MQGDVTSEFLLGLRARVALGTRNVEVALIVVPRGNLMAPPELATDAPVLNVVHPLVVRLRPVLGHEANASVFYSSRRRLCERSNADIPLIREPGLQDRATAITAWHLQ